MVRHRRRRPDHRRDQFRRRARGFERCRIQEPDADRYRLRLDPADQRAVLAEHHQLHLGHLFLCQWPVAHRQVDRPRHLVFRRRRLCARQIAGGGSLRSGDTLWRQGRRHGLSPDQHDGSVVFPAAGAGFEGQGDRLRQCRRRPAQLDQGRERFQHHARPDHRPAGRHHHGSQRARRRGNAGHVPGRAVLLGPRRSLAGMEQALLRQVRQDAEFRAGRRIFGSHELSEGGAGREDRRCRLPS